MQFAHCQTFPRWWAKHRIQRSSLDAPLLFPHMSTLERAHPEWPYCHGTTVCLPPAKSIFISPYSSISSIAPHMARKPRTAVSAYQCLS